MLMAEQVYRNNFVELSLPYDLGSVLIISLDELIKNNLNTKEYIRSYDSAGRVLLWKPPSIGFKKSAADFEHFDRDVTFMSKYLGCDPRYFLPNWVCNETLAKLWNKPIIKLIKEKKFIEFIKSDFDHCVCNNENIRIFYFKLNKYKAHISLGFMF